MSILALSPEAASKLVLSLAIVGGVLMCFFGYRLFKLALGIAGFALGAGLATYLAWRLTAQPDALQGVTGYLDIVDRIAEAPNRALLLVWAAAGGATGAVVSVLMYRVGVFVLGACLGVMLANATMARASFETYLMVLAILGVIGGVVALTLRKAIVVLSTALNGSLALVFAFYALLKNCSPREAVASLRGLSPQFYAVAGCTIVLAAIGACIQFAFMPKEKEAGAPHKDEKKEKK